MSPKEVLEYAKQKEARQFDLRFTDLPGLSQHVSYPINVLEEDSFEEGFGIDGSSIRGWAAINESDMLLLPGAADRPLPGPALRNGADHDRMQPGHRMPSSRSGDRRAGRNRSEIRHAGQVCGQHDALQVHHPQRGVSVRQDGDVHAEAAV